MDPTDRAIRGFYCILIQMSLKFVFKGLIDNKSSLVEVMAYCLTDKRSLPEPMLTTMSDALFYVYGITWPQWVTQRHYFIVQWRPFIARFIIAKIL